VQPAALAGHEQTVATVPSQTSVAEAETVMGAELHCVDAVEMAQVMDGGVVSTTVSELVQLVVWYVLDVATQVIAAPLFA